MVGRKKRIVRHGLDRKGRVDVEKPMIETTGDSVHIHDVHGEIVMWTQAEWEEEPEVVMSIVNAIHIAHTDGPECLRRLLHPTTPEAKGERQHD